MTSINKVRALCIATKHLIAEGLDDIPGLSISTAGGNDVEVGVYPYDTTKSQARRLKEAFGPLAVDGMGDYKTLKSTTHIGNIDDTPEGEVNIVFTIHSAYTCRRIPKEELDEYDVEELLAMAKRGDIELPECKPKEFQDDPTEVD